MDEKKGTFLPFVESRRKMKTQWHGKRFGPSLTLTDRIKVLNGSKIGSDHALTDQRSVGSAVHSSVLFTDHKDRITTVHGSGGDQVHRSQNGSDPVHRPLRSDPQQFTVQIQSLN